MTGNDAPDSAGLGRKQLLAVIAIAALACGSIAGLFARGAIWEGWVLDRLFQVKAHMSSSDVPLDMPVAVVGLDKTALGSDRLATVPRVFMTPVFAETGQTILDAGAIAIGYDFVFAFNADTFSDPFTGEALLRGYDRSFLAFLYKNRGQIFVARTSTGTPHRGVSAASGTSGVRIAEVTPDSDGVVRQHEPEQPLEKSQHLIDGLLQSAGSNVSESYTAIPNYRLASSVPYLSLTDVLEMTGSAEGQDAIRKFAEGRIVLFGSTMPNEDEHLYSDRFLPVLPVISSETGASGRPPVRHATAGVFVLANLIGAPLSGRTAVSPPAGTLYVVALVFAAAGALAGLLLPLSTLPIVALLAVGLGLGLNLFGLQLGILIAPGVAPVACLAAMVVGAVGNVGVLQRRQRELVRLFGHYLSPDVIRQMAQSEQLPSLGGETRQVVVAFIDIVGFTKMSEQLSDTDVVKVVNTCFDEIGRVITDHDGYIDKYIGDAVMAVWNAPNTVTNPEQEAVRAALEIIDLLDDLRKTTGQTGLDLRIALNGGPALVGDIGGEQRRSFTVMGTTVNTASRIESVAKDQNVRLAISETVAGALSGDLPTRKIWQGKLRGLSAETSVYTIDITAVQMSNVPKLATNRSEQAHLKAINLKR
ncbi:MAG: adenylate/guanylate cyclase domain-containing protein [Roseibium sp.]